MTSANGGVTWTGTFTPTDDLDDDMNTCSLATTYTDANGNTGPSASTANYAIDTEAPSASSISMDDTALKAGDTATLTIVFSETVAGFASADDVSCATGTLAAMSLQSGTTWTGTFTPTDDTDDATNVCTQQLHTLTLQETPEQRLQALTTMSTHSIQRSAASS